MAYDKVLVNCKPELTIEQIHQIRDILCDHLELSQDVLHENDESSDEYREITNEIEQVGIIIDALTIGWARGKITTITKDYYTIGHLKGHNTNVTSRRLDRCYQLSDRRKEISC